MKKFIKGVFSAIYKVLSVFNLQFALLVLIVGVILYFCGVFEGGGIPLLIFCMLFICSILAAVIITIKKIFTNGKEKDKDKGSTLQIVKQEDPTQDKFYIPPSEQSFQPIVTEQQTQTYAPQQSIFTQNTPKYYKVKQNPNYVMAEYADRYELFLITPQGLKLVRVDQKR